MKFNRYTDVELFKNDVIDILLEDEVQNNLPVSIIMNSSKYSADNWLLATVTDDNGVIVLVAVCTLPFNLLLYECVSCQGDTPPGRNVPGYTDVGHDTVPCHTLVSELKRINFIPPGVLAESGVARRFADAYCGDNGGKLKMTMKLMKLDQIADYKQPPGFCRVLTEEDLSFTPSWEHAFCVDCDLPHYTYAENYDRIKTRVGNNTHFIWEDGEPVAQAVHGRNTPSGAVISWVYTPPLHRGKGYATAVVAEVSKSAFESGKKFCCLYADAANPASCAVYHKLGYYDVCTFDEIKFDTGL